MPQGLACIQVFLVAIPVAPDETLAFLEFDPGATGSKLGSPFS